MEKLVPKLRFPEFDGNWEEKQIKNVFSIFNGYAFSSLDSTDNGCLWVKIADVGIQEMKKDSLSYLPKDYLEKHSKFTLKEGDLVIALTRPILNGNLKISRIDKFFNNSLLNQRVGKIVSNYNLEYIYYLLQNNKLIKSIENNIAGSDPPNLSPNEINNIYVRLPILAEQQKIASFLTSVDERLTLLAQQKEKLEQYKKGVMQQIFAQKLRFKGENGKDYPDWEKGKFSKFIKLYRGSSPRPIIRYTTTSNDGVNWIKIGDTKDSENYRISIVSEKITKEGALKSRAVKSGEIILANSMSFGKSYLLQIDGCIYDGWFVLREYEKHYEKEFLLQILNSEFLQKQYFKLSTGGVVQNISSEIVYSTDLICPCLEEQQKIASFLSAIDVQIEGVSKKIEQTKLFKKGLLQQLFV